MSMATLLRGVHDYLKTATGDVRDLRMGVQPDAKPDPKMGRWYLSIYPISSRPKVDRNYSSKISEEFGIGCCLTTKFNAPRDRQGAAITLADVGITDTAEMFRDLIHGSDKIINLASSYLPDGGENGSFCETLVWSGTNYSEKDDSWIYSPNSSIIPIIFTAEMQFNGGLRVRSKGPS